MTVSAAAGASLDILARALAPGVSRRFGAAIREAGISAER